MICSSLQAVFNVSPDLVLIARNIVITYNLTVTDLADIIAQIEWDSDCPFLFITSRGCNRAGLSLLTVKLDLDVLEWS